MSCQYTMEWHSAGNESYSSYQPTKRHEMKTACLTPWHRKLFTKSTGNHILAEHECWIKGNDCNLWDLLQVRDQPPEGVSDTTQSTQLIMGVLSRSGPVWTKQERVHDHSRLLQPFLGDWPPHKYLLISCSFAAEEPFCSLWLPWLLDQRLWTQN